VVSKAILKLTNANFCGISENGGRVTKIASLANQRLSARNVMFVDARWRRSVRIL